jgi:hypothetical protein
VSINIAIYEPRVIKRVEKTELTEQQAYDLNIPLDHKIIGDFLLLMLGALTFLAFAFAELLEWNFSQISDVRLQYGIHMASVATLLCEY